MIKRVPAEQRGKERPYTIFDNAALNDERLSIRARGLLAYLLSKPDDWTANSKHLTKQGLEGRDAIRNALQELEAAGYFATKRNHNGAGKFEWRSDVL